MLDVNTATRKQLLSLPYRSWDVESEYDSIIVLNDNGKKHDSGYGLLTIIGCKKGKAFEISSSCSDDINWFIYGKLRTDMVMPSRGMHFWNGYGSKFKIGSALSSIDITLG